MIMAGKWCFLVKKVQKELAQMDVSTLILYNMCKERLYQSTASIAFLIEAKISSMVPMPSILAYFPSWM